MNVRDLTVGQFADRLADDGVAIRSGPFVSRIVARLSELAAPLHELYRDFPMEQRGLVDFHVSLRPSASFSRWINPQVEFLFDGRVSFSPFPRRIALPMLEWGLNWCVYTHANQYLIIHAASVDAGSGAQVSRAAPPRRARMSSHPRCRCGAAL